MARVSRTAGALLVAIGVGDPAERALHVGDAVPVARARISPGLGDGAERGDSIAARRLPLGG